MGTGRYSDEDVEHYDRPRRRTRPRTKERPAYDDAASGVVVTVDRGRYTLVMTEPTEQAGPAESAWSAGSTGLTGSTGPAGRTGQSSTAQGSPGGRPVTAMKARPLGRRAVVVGDRVRVDGDVSGEDGTLARIVEVRPRITTLRRTAEDDDPVERVIVANADQLVVVTALADPEPQPRLVDRALVAAFDAGLRPLLCLTKSDLADPEPFLSTYRSLDVPWVVTHRGGDLSELRERLAGRTSVLLGSSGVGKSTLVNALVPDAGREVGHVNAVTGRGRHTSTSAYLLALPALPERQTGADPGDRPVDQPGEPDGAGEDGEDGEDGAAPGVGWIVDTPGIRSFGLAHVRPEDLIAAFPDLDAETASCPRGCTHGDGEPECGLDEAVADARVGADRVRSFRRLLAARSEPAY